MNDAVLVAIVGPASAIAGILVTHWSETRRDVARIRAERERLIETNDNERRIRSETFIRELRAKQAERIRDWIERQVVASVDITHLEVAGNVQGDPASQAASLAAARTILATRSVSDGRSPSISAALSGVTDADLVRDVRRLSEYDLKFRRDLEPMRQFLVSNPVPWNETQQEELRVLGEELRKHQEHFDASLIDVYAELEDYCAGIEN